MVMTSKFIAVAGGLLIAATAASTAVAVTLATAHHSGPQQGTAAVAASAPATSPSAQPADQPTANAAYGAQPAGTVTFTCAVVPAPSGDYDYHNGGWALKITVTVPSGSGLVFGPDGEIQIVEYDASGTETGSESDDSSSWPIIIAGQTGSFFDTSYDFTGSDPSGTPASCQVVSP